MKKLSLLTLLAVFGALASGCAYTNYALITDNDQVANGQGSGVVNTNGQAKLIAGSQVATIWPDGSDEFFSTVNQASDGDRTITTYNNFSTGGQPTFLDDFYCNPDWNGCALVTAPDPEVGDVDIFDYSDNPNCAGYRSLSVLLSDGRYYGECGRSLSLFPKLAAMGVSDADLVGALQYGVPTVVKGRDMLRLDVNASTVSDLTLTVPGTSISVPVILPAQGSLSVIVDPGARQMLLDVSSAKAFPVVDAWLAAVDEVRLQYGSDLVPFDVSGTAFGMTIDGLGGNTQAAFSPTLDTQAVRDRLIAGLSPADTTVTDRDNRTRRLR